MSDKDIIEDLKRKLADAKPVPSSQSEAPPPAADGRGPYRVEPLNENVNVIIGPDGKSLGWPNTDEQRIAQLNAAHAHGWQAAMKRAMEAVEKSLLEAMPPSIDGSRSWLIDVVKAALDREASNGGEGAR